jgi:hypothetical protein
MLSFIRENEHEVAHRRSIIKRKGFINQTLGRGGGREEEDGW